MDDKLEGLETQTNSNYWKKYSKELEKGFQVGQGPQSKHCKWRGGHVGGDQRSLSLQLQEQEQNTKPEPEWER